MAIPSKKSPGIEQTLTDLFGVDRRTSIITDTCALCKQPAVEFRDSLSEKEYSISGMCQACQDKIFGKRS